MSDYLLVMSQDGEGCGHHVDCGTKVIELKAETLPEAQAEAE